MHVVLEQLDIAEDVFRSVVELEEPLFSKMPVKRAEPDAKHRRHWYFATDNHAITAFVHRPEYILEKFKEVVVPIYEKAYGIQIDDSNIEDFIKSIVQDNFTYLLFHELGHPLYSPDSSWKIKVDEETGETIKEPGDEQYTDDAIKQGIQRAEPSLSPRDVTNKMGNVRNAVWDFIGDDIFFYLSSFNNRLAKRIEKEFEARQKIIGVEQIKRMPDGVVPIWDVVELADEPSQSLFYPITRCVYGLLFARDAEIRGNLYDYFKSKIDMPQGEDLEGVIKESLNGLIKNFDFDELKEARINPARYSKCVDDLVDNYDEDSSAKSHIYLTTKITEIFFNKRLRYKSIEGLVEPLSKYISLKKEENRHGADVPSDGASGDEQTDPGEPGGNAEQALQSIIALGENQEVEQFLTSIANDVSQPQTSRNTRLSNLARDEYYKRHAKPMPIQSPRLDAISIELGRIRRPKRVASYTLTQEELLRLPRDEIMQFQMQTGITQLFEITPYQWRYDVYEWEDSPIEDFTFQKSGIELPKSIVFHLDSSGTMLMPAGTAYVGTGVRFDALQHINYGILKTMLKAATQMDEEVDIVAVNYSPPGKTLISDPIELSNFYNTPNNPGKQIMLNPQGGATHYDLHAYKTAHQKCKPGKTVHIFVADGDLDNDHNANMTQFQWLADQPETAILYFAMFSKGTFAQRVDRFAATRENVNFYHYSQFSQLQKAATNVLIQYTEK